MKHLIDTTTPGPLTWQGLATELDLAEADAVRFGFAACQAARRARAIVNQPGVSLEAVEAAREGAEEADELQAEAEDLVHRINALLRRYQPTDAAELLAKFAWTLKVYAPGLEDAQAFRDFADDLQRFAEGHGRHEAPLGRHAEVAEIRARRKA
jgi:hypothetical protein